jgi:hypothetical protein
MIFYMSGIFKCILVVICVLTEDTTGGQTNYHSPTISTNNRN